MVSSMVVALALAASAQVDVRPELPGSDARPWMIWGGTAANVRGEAHALGGQGFLGVSRNLGAHWRPELDLGLGYDSGPSEVVGSVKVGINFDVPVGPVTPFVWAAFAHNHEMDAEMTMHDPFNMILGMEDGMNHRSGLEGGGGLYARLPGGPGFSTMLGLRLAATLLGGNGPAVSLGGIAMAGVAF